MKAKLHVKTKGNVKILMKLLSQSQGNNSKNINLILKNSYKPLPNPTLFWMYF